MVVRRRTLAEQLSQVFGTQPLTLERKRARFSWPTPWMGGCPAG
jgi:hypothetical protein